jgi:hypothetical protein
MGALSPVPGPGLFAQRWGSATTIAGEGPPSNRLIPSPPIGRRGWPLPRSTLTESPIAPLGASRGRPLQHVTPLAHHGHDAPHQEEHGAAWELEAPPLPIDPFRHSGLGVPESVDIRVYPGR